MWADENAGIQELKNFISSQIIPSIETINDIKNIIEEQETKKEEQKAQEAESQEPKIDKRALAVAALNLLLLKFNELKDENIKQKIIETLQVATNQKDIAAQSLKSLANLIEQHASALSEKNIKIVFEVIKQNITSESKDVYSQAHTLFEQIKSPEFAKSVEPGVWGRFKSLMIRKKSTFDLQKELAEVSKIADKVKQDREAKDQEVKEQKESKKEEPKKQEEAKAQETKEQKEAQSPLDHLQTSLKNLKEKVSLLSQSLKNVSEKLNQMRDKLKSLVAAQR